MCVTASHFTQCMFSLLAWTLNNPSDQLTVPSICQLSSLNMSYFLHVFWWLFRFHIYVTVNQWPNKYPAFILYHIFLPSQTIHLLSVPCGICASVKITSTFRHWQNNNPFKLYLAYLLPILSTATHLNYEKTKHL